MMMNRKAKKMKNANSTFAFANNFEVLTEDRMKTIKGGWIPVMPDPIMSKKQYETMRGFATGFFKNLFS